MPPVRKRLQYSQLSDFDRGRIVGMREAGLSFREIALRVNRVVSTVTECWQAWSQDGRGHRAEGSGRPRATTERQDRRLRLLALRDRKSTTHGLLDLLTSRPLSMYGI